MNDNDKQCDETTLINGIHISIVFLLDQYYIIVIGAIHSASQV